MDDEKGKPLAEKAERLKLEVSAAEYARTISLGRDLLEASLNVTVKGEPAIVRVVHVRVRVGLVHDPFNPPDEVAVGTGSWERAAGSWELTAISYFFCTAVAISSKNCETATGPLSRFHSPSSTCVTLPSSTLNAPCGPKGTT